MRSLTNKQREQYNAVAREAHKKRMQNEVYRARRRLRQRLWRSSRRRERGDFWERDRAAARRYYKKKRKDKFYVERMNRDARERYNTASYSVRMKLKESHRTWVLKNRQKMLGYQEAAYERRKKDPACLMLSRKRAKLWKENNRQRAKESRRTWAAQNRHRIRAQQRSRYHALKNDAEFIAKRKKWRNAYYKRIKAKDK
jgi:hypothetical protein